MRALNFKKKNETKVVSTLLRGGFIVHKRGKVPRKRLPSGRSGRERGFITEREKISRASEGPRGEEGMGKGVRAG